MRWGWQGGNWVDVFHGFCTTTFGEIWAGVLARISLRLIGRTVCHTELSSNSFFIPSSNPSLHIAIFAPGPQSMAPQARYYQRSSSPAPTSWSYRRDPRYCLKNGWRTHIAD